MRQYLTCPTGLTKIVTASRSPHLLEGMNLKTDLACHLWKKHQRILHKQIQPLTHKIIWKNQYLFLVLSLASRWLFQQTDACANSVFISEPLIVDLTHAPDHQQHTHESFWLIKNTELRWDGVNLPFEVAKKDTGVDRRYRQEISDSSHGFILALPNISLTKDSEVSLQMRKGRGVRS